MSFIKINSRLRKRSKSEVHMLSAAAAIDGAKIKVLVGSCLHCAKLYDNTVEAMNRLRIPLSELERIDEIGRIAKIGVITTPALIINGKLLAVGKVLSIEEIVDLISKEYAGGECQK